MRSKRSPCTGTRRTPPSGRCTPMCRRAAAHRARPACARRSGSSRRPTAGASPTSATCASRSVPGALRRGRRGRDGDRVGPRLRRPDPPQRHRLLEVAPSKREPVDAELHAVDLPDTIPQRDPEAIPDDTPPCYLVAELGGAVAPDHDVADLVLRLRLPRALEAGAALTTQTDGVGKQTDDHIPKERHGKPSRRVVAGKRQENTYPGNGTTVRSWRRPPRPPRPPRSPPPGPARHALRRSATPICASSARTGSQSPDRTPSRPVPPDTPACVPGTRPRGRVGWCGARRTRRTRAPAC